MPLPGSRDLFGRSTSPFRSLRRGATTAALVALLVVSMVGLLGPAPAFAQTNPVTTNTTFTVKPAVFVPCANDGQGENILLSGTAHLLVHMATDESGGTHFVLAFNYQRMSGAGLVTGDKYVGIDAEITTSYDFDPFVAPPYELTFTHPTRFIGQGPGNNFMLFTQNHFTVDATGKVTSSRFRFTIECR
jgi:hypothetical protein